MKLEIVVRSVRECMVSSMVSLDEGSVCCSLRKRTDRDFWGASFCFRVNATLFCEGSFEQNSVVRMSLEARSQSSVIARHFRIAVQR